MMTFSIRPTLFVLLSSGLLLCGCDRSYQPAVKKVNTIGLQAVQAELILDHVTLYPGRTGLLGVRLTMAPGWKTYWSNPGDAGAPTTLKVSVPEGWEVGPVLFPFPKKFDQFGSVGYGYENQVLLMVQITPPRHTSMGTLASIGVQVKWLACGDTCVPGEADLQENLYIGYRNKSEHLDEFARWMRRLPIDGKPFTQSIQKPTQAGEPWTAMVKWSGAIKNVQFFPNAPFGIQFKPLKVKHNQSVTTLQYTPHFPGNGIPLNLSSIEGLFVYEAADGQTYGAVTHLPIVDESEPVPPSPF